MYESFTCLYLDKVALFAYGCDSSGTFSLTVDHSSTTTYPDIGARLIKFGD